MSKGVAIVSGGLDSVTLAYRLKAEGHDVHLLSFDYGQRHSKELRYAKLAARNLGMKWTLVDLTGLGSIFAYNGSASSLVNSQVDVPEGHYTEENMKATVVPNRNMIMLSIAAGLAVSEKAEFIATAVHAGDHAIYPSA